MARSFGFWVLRLLGGLLAATVSLSYSTAGTNTRLFATDPVRGIIEIDAADGAVLNMFATPADQGTSDGLAYDGNHLWYISGSFEPNTLYQLDPNDGQIIDSYTLPNSAFRNGLAAQSGLIYILDWSAITQDITVFDPATASVVDTLDINGANTAAPAIGGGLAAIGNPNALILTTALSGELLEVDPQTGIINNRFEHDLGGGAQGVAVVGGLIYVARNASNQLSTFDRAGNLQDQFEVSDAIGMLSLAGDEGTRSERIFADAFETSLNGLR